ncbi:MAG TPA: aldose 1-epimerase family protein [Acidimicrobiales bacterium]|nr:aldose 1-epimerase family protein [Acidimicrobiales bacterium]
MPATTTDTVAPSGAQYEIGHGRHHVVVTEVGATVRSYTVDGRPVLDGFGEDELCDAGRGQVLAPWPNRLGDGRYSFEGRDAQAALDEPGRHNAIHGLVRWLPWQVTSRAQNVLALGCVLHPQPGYPWRLSLAVEYRLGRDGLSVAFSATNLDRVAAPFGVGFHPYLTLSTASIDTASLAVPARRRLVTDERGLPTSAGAVAGSELDFTARRWVGTTRLDTAFTDLQHDRDGMARVELDDPGGRGVTVWMDERFRYVMVYTGDTLEPPARRRTSIAVEPMSCPPDALRSGVDLVRLEPGASWAARWGITPR